MAINNKIIGKLVLVETLKRSCDEPVEKIKLNIFEAIKDFTPHDDITFLVLKKL